MGNTTNYSTLQRNAMGSLSLVEAESAFLWACGRKNSDKHQYKAEKFAREVDRLRRVLPVMLGLAEKSYTHLKAESVIPDLLQFMLRRHCFYRFPEEKEAWL